MAILFSKVILSTRDRNTTFLISGIPANQSDFYGWTAYERFMKEVQPNKQVDATVYSYLYGGMEPEVATLEEVAYMQMRLDRRADFLESR